jgi:hypothetical protein
MRKAAWPLFVTACYAKNTSLLGAAGDLQQVVPELRGSGRVRATYFIKSITEAEGEG